MRLISSPPSSSSIEIEAELEVQPQWFLLSFEVTGAGVDKIQASATFWGIVVQSDIREDRILKEFLAPMPWWDRWLTRRYVATYENNPQIGYIFQVKLLNMQGVHALIQAVCFLGFIGSGFIFALET